MLSEAVHENQRDTVTTLVERLMTVPRLAPSQTVEELPDPGLDRSWLRSLFLKPQASGWRATQSHRDHNPSFGQSVLRLLGHLLGTAVLYVTLFTLAWGLSFFCTWLNSMHPFSDEALRHLLRVEVAVLYCDTALCACVHSKVCGDFSRR